MHDFPKPSSIVSKLDDKVFVEKFMEHMTILTRESGIDFVIDTSEDYIAKANKENGKIYFNPKYTLWYLNQLKEKIREDTWIKSDFIFTERHLAQLMLHEINHYKNHAELKLSTKTINIDGKTMTMIEYRHHIHRKYGQEFHRFENVCEDIDVDNHSIIQAPVYKSALDEWTKHLYIPSNDFSELPLHKQFAWNCIGNSRIEKPCIVDPIVRWCVDFIRSDWWLLQIIQNPTLSYDEQFPMIVQLYEEYYLILKAQQKQKDEENDQNKDQTQHDQWKTNPNQWPSQPWSDKNKNPSDQEWQDNKWQHPNDASSWAEWSKDKKSQNNKNNTDNQAGKEVNANDDNSSTWSAWKETTGSSQTSKNPPSPSLLPHIFDNLDKDGKPQATPNTDNTLDKTQQQLNNALKDGSSWAERSGVEGSPNNQKNTNPLLDALQQAIENTILESRKTPEDRTLEHQIANERWLDPNKDKDEIMKQKKKIKKRKEEIDPKLKDLRDRNGDKIYDKIVDEIFAKIVSLRSKSTILEKTPRRFSNGGQFDGRSLVWGIMSWKAGDSDPLIMKQQLREQKELPKAGAFNNTLILDASISMRGKKNEDQKLSTLLYLTALNQCNTQLKSELWPDEFGITTQVIMFLGKGKYIIIKPRSDTLDLKDIIEIIDHLDFSNWPDTNAYDAMEYYHEQITHPLLGQTSEEHTQRLETIKDGKTKETLFIMSDGWFNSWDDSKAKTLNKTLRDMGVIVCGIGITADGHPMEEIFGKKSENPKENTWGFWLVCGQTADLGITLNSLLLEHLEDPSIVGV